MKLEVCTAFRITHFLPEKPRCCAEYKYLHSLSSVQDGEYDLYPGTPVTGPISLYCYNTPASVTGFREFVTLPPGPSVNDVHYHREGTGGSQNPGTTVFTKIGVNPLVSV